MTKSTLISTSQEKKFVGSFCYARKKRNLFFMPCHACMHSQGRGTHPKNSMTTNCKRVCWKHLAPWASRNSVKSSSQGRCCLQFYLADWEGFLPGAFCSVEVWWGWGPEHKNWCCLVPTVCWSRGGSADWGLIDLLWFFGPLHSASVVTMWTQVRLPF